MVEDHPTPNDRAARPPPQGPTIGGGRYTLVSKIAEGGMAGVYRAWDHKMRLWRAIKVLLPEYTRRDILRDRFEGEAKTMARLDHPHIIRVYDVGTREALPYMVMELAEGGTINGWIDAYGPMPARLAASVVTQVADGLAAAHALNVVHRDVKPHNVLVTADGLCKVTDFGIAHGAIDHDRTKTNATMGTLGYMAPEQRSDARLVDPRADIYSLGAMLYKMVVGRVITDLFLVEHEPDLLVDVPEPLHEVILRACYHDRGRRYPDTRSLIRALTEILPLLPPDPAGTPSLVQPAGPPMREASEGFPEIGPLLGVAPRQAPPLPYTMPTRPASPRSLPPVDAVGDDLPDYVDRAANPSRSPPGSPSHSPAVERSRSPRPAPQAPPARGEVEATTIGAAAEAPRPAGMGALGEPLWPPFVRGLMMATVALWGITVVLTGVSAYDIRQKATATAAARQELLRVIDVEQALLIELADHGSPPANTHALSELYDRVTAGEGGFAQAHAIAAYLSGVRHESDSELAGSSPGDLAFVRARNLRQAWMNYVRTRQDWVRTTRWPQGWLATRLGLAPRPWVL